MAAPLAAQKPTPSKPEPPKPAASISKLDASPQLDAFLAEVAKDTVAEFSAKGLTDEGISIAVIDLTAPTPVSSFSAGAYRGDVSYYPCSVVKICYLSYYEAQKEAGKLQDTPELVRAVKDMITVSSNDATGFVVDSITGTTSGPEIADSREWERWKARRNVVNDWYRTRGYTNLNANQKTFCEDAYGRETAFRDGGKNRNRMTAMEAARLFKEIVRGEVAGEILTAEMSMLLSRDITGEEKLEEMEPEDARLAGQGLPKGSRLWAKSGDAYDFHHLVGRVALPNGSDFVIAVFTKGVKTVPEVIPRVYEKVAAHFAAAGRR
jgi:beta-lactamase class A